MNPLFLAAREICDFLTRHDWPHCLIGGLAVQHWGEPRTTLDADFTLLTGWGGEEVYVDKLLDVFNGRVSGARDFALSRRVLLIRASNGVDVDITLGALPFEAEMVSRAVLVDFMPGVQLPCCTADDLFVMKAFAARSRDWADLEGIAARQSGKLDIRHIERHLAELCELKGDPDIFPRAQRILGVA